MKITIEEKTLNSLDYEYIREELKKCASSGLGKSKIDHMTPQTEERVIKHLLDETEEGIRVYENYGQVPLQGIIDIKQSFQTVSKGGHLQPKALTEFADFLRSVSNTKKFLVDNPMDTPILDGYATGLNSFKEIENEIRHCIEGITVADRASSQLKSIRKKITINENKIVEKVNRFINNDKYKMMLQDQYYTIKSGYYVIPVVSSYKNQIPGKVIEQSSKGTTSYILLDSVESLNTTIEMLRFEEENEVFQILMMLTGMILEKEEEIKNAIDIIGQLDYIFARSKYSIKINGNRPSIVETPNIYLKEMKHPMLGDECHPITFAPLKATHITTITGPNTGGKTVTLKMIGLMVLLNQSGIFISAHEDSFLPIYKNIFVDIGDQQNLKTNLSTFSGHLKNIAAIIKASNKKTLVLIDEIGTGTDPKDGSALGISIMLELLDRQSTAVVSTHYGEIKDFSEKAEGFENASMSFDKQTLKPKYELIMGSVGSSNAYWIASELGINEKIVKRAENISHQGYEKILLKNHKKEDYNMQRQEYKKYLEEVKIREETKEIDKKYMYQKGDKVIIKSKDAKGIVYEVDALKDAVTVFQDGEYMSYPSKLLQLEFSAIELYPEGYDLDQLFISFQKRKIDKDIEKGRFKNLKDLKNRLDQLD